MCVPNAMAPLFSAARYMIGPLFSTKSIWLTQFFWYMKAPHPTFFWHPGIRTYFSLRDFWGCIICLITSNKWVQKINSQYMNGSPVHTRIKITSAPTHPQALKAHFDIVRLKSSSCWPKLRLHTYQMDYIFQFWAVKNYLASNAKFYTATGPWVLHVLRISLSRMNVLNETESAVYNLWAYSLISNLFFRLIKDYNSWCKVLYRDHDKSSSY